MPAGDFSVFFTSGNRPRCSESNSGTPVSVLSFRSIHNPNNPQSSLSTPSSFSSIKQSMGGGLEEGGIFLLRIPKKESKCKKQLCMIFYPFCAPNRCASILIYSFPLARLTSKWCTGCKDMLLSLFLELRVDPWAAFSSSLWQKDYFFSPVQLLVKSVKNRIFSRSLARTVQILGF